MKNLKEKIVKTGLKVDFHIHSAASSHKDPKKVKDCTIDNIGTLIDKLVFNNVNIVSITDHDNFDYALYKKLKEEEENDNCIQKVLPGVEFTVKINNKVLHIVTLFDDADDNKIKKIPSLIFSNKPLYDEKKHSCFSEEKYIEILRDIDTNVILIAHQKETLSSKNPRKNDANTVGKEKFKELIFIDYFEAFEFKNKRNEIFNKVYLKNSETKIKNIRFITGSDCHNWSEYPEPQNDDSFEFSYFKCLPTFRGVMMAITDTRRIKVGVNSFFSQSESIKEILVKIDEDEYLIELSNGINAIIGDNSIGKSLLLHKLTEYREISKNNKLVKAYDDYLKENNIEVKTFISEDKIRQFDKQGNIREIFANNHTSKKDFLKKYYPNEPNYESEKQDVINKVNEFINLLKHKEKIYSSKTKLSNVKLEVYEERATSLQINNVDIDVKLKTKDEKLENLIVNLETIIKSSLLLLEEELLNKTEKKSINNYVEILKAITEKYQIEKHMITKEINKINIINNILTISEQDLFQTKTDTQKSRENYNNKLDLLQNTIINLHNLTKNQLKFKLDVNEYDLAPSYNIVGDYRFICKAKNIKIDSLYLKKILLEPLDTRYSKKIIDMNDIDPKELKENINKLNESVLEKLDFYKERIIEILDRDFKVEYSINNKVDKNITNELSTGANARIYFELLSKDTKNNGIYIIDQPEDDVSQPTIKKKLLEYFKNISENRQVIMITHNPQFIVNLDVDNVIFIKKNDETQKIEIKYGALEYKQSDVDILKIVAENIEGGIDSIKERYKKYEKNY